MEVSLKSAVVSSDRLQVTDRVSLKSGKMIRHFVLGTMSQDNTEINNSQIIILFNSTAESNITNVIFIYCSKLCSA